MSGPKHPHWPRCRMSVAAWRGTTMQQRAQARLRSAYEFGEWRPAERTKIRERSQSAMAEVMKDFRLPCDERRGGA